MQQPLRHPHTKPNLGQLLAKNPLGRLWNLSCAKPISRFRLLNFAAPKEKYTVLHVEGDVQVTQERIKWRPGKRGGTLRYSYEIAPAPDERQDSAHNTHWALLRLDDLFPRATVRAKPNTTNRATLELIGPEDWAFESRYGPSRAKIELTVGDRVYNRPNGWLLAGELGIRRTVVAGSEIAVAAPKGMGFRRLDMLAFLRWTVPTLKQFLPQFPKQILIVGAPDELWRGGLSAPGSLYVHSGRPLVSENGTSTLLHELAHISGLHSAQPGADWIVEGLAEYLSILALRRSSGLSEERFQKTLTSLQQWVDQQDGQLADPSKGANTAAAVLLFSRLHQAFDAEEVEFATFLHTLMQNAEFSQVNLEATVRALLKDPNDALREIAAAGPD